MSEQTGPSTTEQTSPVTERYKFFNHSTCEFYPCHDMPAGELNCLFCFCPLYALGPDCGGNPTYVGENHDIKDCSNCTLPHRRANYDYVMSQFERIKELAAKH
ncbi:cysteine-rich small domain-containing protein [Enorma phocaeensis]|uniref:cysteine-rich small domain-containing protein n=1 Tax=Enorma phocaeensis TaxID=1871019 RepID=UPI002354CFBC|nr:cysteine-rich small domain-containing protein [Enorma phocaeensis]